MYIALLVFAAALYALSFYFNRNVERQCNDGIDTAILFTTVVWAEVCIGVMIFMKGEFQFTWFSLICAAIYAFFLVLFGFLNLKALSVADLLKYSMFTMLGGMMVPFVFGILFFKEELGIGKIICCILVILGLYLDSRGGKIEKKAIVYLIAVFFVNGSFGVVSAFHQNSSNVIVGTLQYMWLQAVLIILFGVIWLTARKLKNKNLTIVKNKKAYGNMLLYGLFYGSAELILLFAIKHVQASVQYPIITGGTIIFSTVISMLIGENKNWKSLIPVAITFVGLLFLL